MKKDWIGGTGFYLALAGPALLTVYTNPEADDRHMRNVVKRGSTYEFVYEGLNGSLRADCRISRLANGVYEFTLGVDDGPTFFITQQAYEKLEADLLAQLEREHPLEQEEADGGGSSVQGGGKKKRKSPARRR